MRVIHLQAENFKRLLAIEVTPKGDVIKVTGKNAAGKSSVLDAIWAVMGGKKASPEKPIRSGAKAAVATVDLGDLVAQRRWTESGSTLTVTNKDGARFPNPQKVLDDLVGQLTFDPLSFMTMDAKAQAATLRELVGLDFTDLDMVRATHYDNRTIAGRDLKQLEARGQALVVPDDAPDGEVNPQSIVARLSAAQEANSAITARRTELDRNRNVVASYRKECDVKRMEVEALERTLSEASEHLKQMEAEVTALQYVDVAPIHAEAATLQQRNEAARAKVQRRQLRNEFSLKQAEVEGLTAKIDKIDADKAAALTAAKFPVAGLSFGADGLVTLDGIPLSQVSQAQKLKISMGMAMAMNPKLRVLRVTDASLLDSASLAIIDKMAGEHDFQVWLEVVDETGKVGVVIEDGKVIADNQS